MWLDGIHMSTSVASLEFEPINEGTRFTHVEHGVFFDQCSADGPGREEGTRGLLEVWATTSRNASRDRASNRFGPIVAHVVAGSPLNLT